MRKFGFVSLIFSLVLATGCSSSNSSSATLSDLGGGSASGGGISSPFDGVWNLLSDGSQKMGSTTFPLGQMVLSISNTAGTLTLVDLVGSPSCTAIVPVTLRYPGPGQVLLSVSSSGMTFLPKNCGTTNPMVSQSLIAIEGWFQSTGTSYVALGASGLLTWVSVDDILTLSLQGSSSSVGPFDGTWNLASVASGALVSDPYSAGQVVMTVFNGAGTLTVVDSVLATTCTATMPVGLSYPTAGHATLAVQSANALYSPRIAGSASCRGNSNLQSLLNVVEGWSGNYSFSNNASTLTMVNSGAAGGPETLTLQSLPAVTWGIVGPLDGIWKLTADAVTGGGTTSYSAGKVELAISNLSGTLTIVDTVGAPTCTATIPVGVSFPAAGHVTLTANAANVTYLGSSCSGSVSSEVSAIAGWFTTQGVIDSVTNSSTSLTLSSSTDTLSWSQ